MNNIDKNFSTADIRSDISIIINNSKCICSDLQHADYSPAYAWFNYFLIIILLPSISVFGVLANILNIYVYSRKRMQTSANNYLLFLACSDFLVILTGLFIFWLDSARSYIPSLAHVPYMTVYALPFGYMAQTCSIYFTVAAAIDCYVQVSWEEIRDNYCTVKKAMEINICITLCSIIYNSLRFPQFNLRKCFHDATQELIIEICPTALFFAINTIYNVYMYMILMTLLPFLCLSILNAMIVVRKSVKPTDLEQNDSSANISENNVLTTYVNNSKSQGLRKALPEDSNKDNENISVENDDDTLTMIMVVVIFLCCNTLALIVNLIETFFNPDALLLNFLTDGSNFLVIFNSSVNCLIYLIFNKIYRQIFFEAMDDIKRLVHRKYFHCWKNRGEGLLNQKHLILIKPINKNRKGRRDQSKNIEIIENKPTYQVNKPVWELLDQHNSDIQRLCKSKLTTKISSGLTVLKDVPFEPQNLLTHQTNFEAETHNSWGESSSNKQYYSICPHRWIAEVKVEPSTNFGSSRPHIYVKPLLSLSKPTFNVTTL